MSLVIEDAALARLDGVVDHAIGAQRIVGTVVLVARDGRLIYRRTAGLADRERSVPMDFDTIFRLASITKPLVSSLAMQLAEQGRIGLDDPVTRYLPAFRPRLADGTEPVITLRHLLTHTSGLGYRFAEPPDGPYHRLDVSDGVDQPGLGLQENLRRLARAPLLSRPGERWFYAIGIDVLGGVIEEALQQPLADAMRERVTSPLGMDDTAFHAVDPARLAKPYADGKPEPIPMTDGMDVPLDIPGFNGAVRFAPSRIFDPASYNSGGAGMAGTAADLLRFFEAIRTGGAPILKATTVAEMMQAQVGPSAGTRGPGWGFGFGWAVLADAGKSDSPQSQGTIEWDGAYGGRWFVDPARKLTVIALTNTSFEGTGGTFPIAMRDALYG